MTDQRNTAEWMMKSTQDTRPQSSRAHQDLFFSADTFELGDYTVHIGYTSTAAGNLGLHVDAGEPQSETLKHRAHLQDIAGTGPFLYLNQVHGADIVCADEFPAERLRLRDSSGEYTAERAHILHAQSPEADASYSCTGKPLAIMVADCIPVVFIGETADPLAPPITAVAHAGRPGLLAGVLQRTVMTLRNQGAVQIYAWLGPSICGACYEVPADMRERAAAQIPELYAQTHEGTPALDLPAGAQSLLKQLQVKTYTELSACTYEHDDLYSHRGYTNRGETPGRIAGLVWVRRNPAPETTTVEL